MTDDSTGRMSVAIPLFEQFTALDAIGPYEVLQRIPTIDVVFVGHETGEVRSDNRMLGITRDAVFEDVPDPDVLVFPGGFGTRALEHDQRVLDWVRTAHRSTTYTTSVCTGSLVLAAAGLLSGRTATTHWSTYAELERYGVTAVPQRVMAVPVPVMMAVSPPARPVRVLMPVTMPVPPLTVPQPLAKTRTTRTICRPRSPRSP